MPARTFKAYRPDAALDGVAYTSNTEPQFEGVEFSDGTVALRWLTAVRSTSVWASLDDALAVHGHADYGSYLVWDDDGSRHDVGPRSDYTSVPATDSAAPVCGCGHSLTDHWGASSSGSTECMSRGCTCGGTDVPSRRGESTLHDYTSGKGNGR